MPKKPPNEVGLHNYDIYRVSNIEAAEPYPESLRIIFKVVNNSKTLQSDYFASPPKREDRRDFDTDAGRDYDLLLTERANDLMARCGDPSMNQSSEAEWMSDLSRLVFLQFKRKEEEQLDLKRPFHHCLACRRNFPPGSRPIINTLYTDRSRANLAAKHEHGDIIRPHFELCKSGDEHCNLPNLDIADHLSYYDDDGEVSGSSSYQIPDATLGLCTYILNQAPWAQREDLIDNDRVKLFDNIALAKILKHFGLQGPYMTVSSNPFTPMFGFGLWEAKKSKEGNHTTTFLQTARKLATLLRWQRKIFDTARCEDFCPFVWFFSSVGPEWEIRGCYETKKPRNEGYQYPMVPLWRGSSEDRDSALQLLYIVDIIKFWAEYTYKPTIGACLSRLQAIKANASPVPLENTLWASQIAINAANTPWFFDQRRPHETSSASRFLFGNLESPQVDSLFGHRSSVQSHSPAPRQSSRRRNQRNTTPAREHYAIPEIESYNWILDRDPGEGDLLLIRVDGNGERLRPVVFFELGRGSSMWNDRKFISILADEKQRHNSDIRARFKVDAKGYDYLWNCCAADSRHIRSDTQFSAILPLKREDYERQRVKPDESQLFEPLESLLGIPVLLAEIDRAYEQWCSCNCPWNEYSPDMIQCGNAKCNLGWYHMKCVGLDEDDDLEHWLCDTCYDIPDHKRTIKSSREYDDTVEASSYRVQRTRTLRRAWNKHAWPSADEVRRKYQKVALNLDLVKSAQLRLHRVGVERDSAPPRYWALPKYKPRKLTMASSRTKQLVYHKEFPDDDDEDSPGGSGENDNASDDEAVDGIEDALDGLNIGRRPRSRG